MRILIVIDGFFPGEKYGGPSVSVDNFCNFMAEVDCYIVTRDHDMGEKERYKGIKDGWNKRGLANVLYLPDNEMNYNTLKQVIREVDPDFIYIQSLFELKTLQCLQIAKKQHIKVLLAPRGQLCKGAFDKMYKKLPFIYVLRMLNLLDGVIYQSTSDEETETIEKYLKAKKEDIHLLSNIPSVPQGLSEKSKKIAGEAKFVFLSRIVGKKNLLNAIRFFKDIHGKVIFDIYGPKQDETYWQKCESVIKGLPDTIKVEYRGELGHQDVHNALRKYDAFIFPTFSENYGHVIAEALTTGCIAIISDQTPWTDINEAGAGWAIPLDAPESFNEAIQKVVDMDNVEYNQFQQKIRLYLEKKLHLQQLKVDYLNVFNCER